MLPKFLLALLILNNWDAVDEKKFSISIFFILTSQLFPVYIILFFYDNKIVRLYYEILN